MPLSDEERQTLAAMERAISQGDPHFADAVSIERQQRLQRRRSIWAAVPAVTGAAFLVAGLVAAHPGHPAMGAPSTVTAERSTFLPVCEPVDDIDEIGASRSFTDSDNETDLNGFVHETTARWLPYPE